MSIVDALGSLFDAQMTGEVSVLNAANPESTGWRYLTYATLHVAAGSTIDLATGESEVAIVPLSGDIVVDVNGGTYRLARGDVWRDAGSVLYVPPGESLHLSTSSGAVFAVGGAPADPVYPVRMIEAADVRVEMRGGGTAHRQVSHLLAPPIEAHRLILYEVRVPRGSWSGWPPHCHDGYRGSPYLEETYYFELQPSNGFAIHRNFRDIGDATDGASGGANHAANGDATDGVASIDETFVARHRDLVTVPAGYHTTAACPGSHMYFLNFLAGDLEHDGRRTPPCFDDRFTWIDGHWDDHPLDLPTR